MATIRRMTEEEREGRTGEETIWFDEHEAHEAILMMLDEDEEYAVSLDEEGLWVKPLRG